jgi:hypothetical protein
MSSAAASAACSAARRKSDCMTSAPRAFWQLL